MKIPKCIDLIAWAATFALVVLLLMLALAFLYESLSIIKAAF